jgi:hypothetical protein
MSGIPFEHCLGRSWTTGDWPRGQGSDELHLKCNGQATESDGE